MAAPAYRPAAAAQFLGVPASTLRRWSRQFADFLTPAAGEFAGTRGHRRYAAVDLQRLAVVKRLLEEGLTYHQVRERLAQGADAAATEPAAALLAAGSSFAIEKAAMLMSLDGEEGPPLKPAAKVGELLTDTLYSLSDSQQIILSNQQTARQLLGVLLQDNFSLKEENSKLRERMLEIERKLFETQRRQAEGREQERERMRQMEQYLFDLQRRLDGLASSPSHAAQAPPPPLPAPSPAAVADLAPPPDSAPPSSPPKPGLWQRLWGGRR